MKDPYEILGVDRTSSDQEIKQAFNKLAKKHHPDMGGDSEKFAEINDAYDRIQKGEPASPFDGRHNPFDQDIFRDFNLDDIFGSHWTRRGNTNVTIALHVKLDEVLSNAKKTLKLKLPSGGSRTVTIELPNGATTGKKVIYHGYGDNTKDAPPGDLYVTFIIDPHPIFSVDGYDIYVSSKISLTQAMVGTDIAVPTVDNTDLKLRIKPGTQHNTKLRIPEKGLRDTSGRRGSMYVEISVPMPSITEEQLDDPIRSLDKSSNV